MKLVATGRAVRLTWHKKIRASNFTSRRLCSDASSSRQRCYQSTGIYDHDDEATH